MTAMEASQWKLILISSNITVVVHTCYYIIHSYYVHTWYELGDIMYRVRIFPSVDNPLWVAT